MMQTQIPDGLQALLQASQILSKQASPTAPGPQGPQPTVAERVNQQIQQVVRPPQQPQGIMGMPPNLREIGQQAGIGGQIMAQKAAQQQQQAQNPQAVAQMAAQMLQNQGVASLPSNLQFKEGGIIGFAGEEDSYVPEVNVPGMEALREILAGSEGVQVASTDNQTALQALEDARQKLVAATKSGDPQAAQFYARQVANIEAQIPPAPKVPVQPVAEGRSPDGTPDLAATTRARLKDIANVIPSGLPAGSGIELFRTAFADQKEPTPAAAPQRSGIKQMTPQEVSQLRENPYARSGITQMTPQEVADLRRSPYGAAKPADQDIVKAMPPRAAAPAAPTAPARPALKPEGILSTLPATAIDKTGIEVPSAETIKTGVETLAPKRAEQFNQELANIEKKRAEVKAAMPDLNQKEIEALEEAKVARKQLAASKAERDQFNRVRSFFRDLYTKGDSYGAVQEGIFARDEAERLADLNHSKAVILLQKAQQAEKLGDLDRAAALKKEAYGRLTEEDKHLGEMAKIIQALQSSRYTAETGLAARQAEITSSERRTRAEIEQRDDEAKQRHAIERQKLAQAERLGAESKLVSQANVAMGKLTDAWKAYEKVKEENKMGLMLTDKDIKDETSKKMRDDAVKAVNQAYSNLVIPAQTMYNNLAGKVLGTPQSAPDTGSSKTMTMADVRTTAQASGRSEADVIARAKAAGYTIK